MRELVIGFMIENIYILNEYYHTGQLRSAAYELNSRAADISEYCIYRIGQVDPREDPQTLPLRLRFAVQPQSLPRKDTIKWQRTHGEMTKLLNATHIMKSLSKTEMRLGEHLPEVPEFEGYHEAFTYFKSASRRITYLLSQEGLARLDSARLATYSFVESWALGRAVFDGVYFTSLS